MSLTKERLAELWEWVEQTGRRLYKPDLPARFTDLLAVLDEVERLRVSQAEINAGATQEVVRLQKKCREWEAKYLKRHEEWAKAEAELERARKEIKRLNKAIDETGRLDSERISGLKAKMEGRGK